MPVITYFEDDDGDTWGVVEGRLRLNGSELADAREFADFIYAELAKADPAKDAPAKPDDGWVEWDGGPCPVDADERVDLTTRKGEVFLCRKAGNWNWQYGYGGIDIVRYRPSKGGAE